MKPEVQLVFDGTTFEIPSSCGTPADGQMLGTQAERLAELAGRECYDSLGKGRDSVAYHHHVLEVGHLSVYEHFNFTVRLDDLAYNPEALLELMNRPGLWVRVDWQDLFLTLNLRCVLDWEKWCPPHLAKPCALPLSIAMVAHEVAPTLMRASGRLGAPGVILDRKAGHLTGPAIDEERWVTLRLTGSRGFSHEQVRHGDRTAMSQRSTRYVDEAASPWCLHPLVRELVAKDPVLDLRISEFVLDSQDLYTTVVRDGSAHLMNRSGLSAVGARKQSRGAARGFLGNALGTSLIFSASVAQWRRMLALRAHPAADAEIRESAAETLRCLKRSAYGSQFDDMVLGPSPDGLGEVLIDANTQA